MKPVERIARCADDLMPLIKEDRNVDVALLYSFALGAVLALRKAIRDGYAPRRRRDARVTLRVARAIAHGGLPAENSWESGFYFNSALLRIAAVAERALRVLTSLNGREDFKSLRKSFKRTHPTEYQLVDWEKLRQVNVDVNRLKHSNRSDRSPKLEVGLDALEQAVRLCTFTK